MWDKDTNQKDGDGFEPSCRTPGFGTTRIRTIIGDGQRQPNECGLFTFVCPRQNQVLDRPHRYLIHRIFRISVVLLKWLGVENIITEECILEEWGHVLS